ncbi:MULTISPECIES: cell division protein ZapA [Reichenbachiella]|uniref:Cell division protein ZapA n=1 Tax=Reichenbachiella agariperforans TaxID=156994 RepID=A0A1M6M2H2_REIAG|nr:MULTISPECIES: cell division protein ZapA [Reichenbachiella]MBU2914539.1 cell division protein ZapA [Reichenbachiella agariperforans]RJE73956.1 cell division protein ZapA [Reichenbachiella sp. MSK19-1]SHJ77694.1 cell division protein ZapA [Reichenbachiella agariperforans]
MTELSIKIKIGNREYPMKVSAEEEARIRAAGKKINERLRFYQDQFQIDDKQDLLAMVAIDCYVQLLQTSENRQETDETAMEQISKLNHLISEAL